MRVRFFASVEAAHAWQGMHRDTLLLSLQQGFELGQAVNRRRFGGGEPGGGASGGATGG